MISRRLLCLSLTAIVTGCGEATSFAYISGDTSCIGAKIYADDRMIGQFEEYVSVTTAEKSASAKGLWNGYGPYNVPKVPRTAKRVRIVHPDGRELNAVVPSNPTELYGDASFDKMMFNLS